MIKNDIFLRILDGEITERPAVWMMRQAGRYLPEFRALREKYDFFTRCRTPEIASELTVQPVDIIGVDVAILFSDILVVPQAMNITITMNEGIGPVVPSPIRTDTDAERLVIPDVRTELKYVADAIKMTKEKLANRVPLIGFAGSPWTIFCYLAQGRGSKNFEIAKTVAYTNPKLADKVLSMITDTTIEYLKMKVEAGVDAIQIFDSWGGVLSPDDYALFSLKYIERIVNALSPISRVIVFAKGCQHSLDKISMLSINAAGVDWTCSPEEARRLTGGRIALQGNFDPARLLGAPNDIERLTREMIKRFGKEKYIVNLGHGILPNTPVENAKIFVDTVKNYI